VQYLEKWLGVDPSVCIRVRLSTYQNSFPKHREFVGMITILLRMWFLLNRHFAILHFLIGPEFQEILRREIKVVHMTIINVKPFHHVYHHTTQQLQLIDSPISFSRNLQQYSPLGTGLQWMHYAPCSPNNATMISTVQMDDVLRTSTRLALM